MLLILHMFLVCSCYFVVVIVVGPKSIKRFVKLMTQRIDWYATNNDEDDEDDEEAEDQTVSKCELVWQVSIARQWFSCLASTH
jgi:U4/U6 small nuclear ribonucleoprotein PRP3